MISYSTQARRAIARLYRPYNDFDVFVEDSTLLGVYERIINRTLKGKGSVSRVIPLGPRSEVIAAAEGASQSTGRAELYIVDGDLDLMSRWRNKRIDNLHRLKVYSIENLVSEINSLESLVGFCLPNHSKSSAISTANPLDIMQEIENNLLKYFTLLAIARRLKLRGSIYAFNPPSVSRQHNGRPIGVCGIKTYNRCRQIMSAIISEVGRNKYALTKAEIKGIMGARRIEARDLIPAREFGLSYLRNRIANSGGSALNSVSAVSYLADHCKLAKDTDLKSKIRAIGRNLNP